MRRRTTSKRRRHPRPISALLTVLALTAGGVGARAQTGGTAGVSVGGGLELVLPVGAEAEGLGQAVVADFLGSESIWWNPAALGRAQHREVAIHHSQTFAYTGDAISALVPIHRVGTVALSVDLYSYGTQQETDVTGTLGTFTPRATIFAATFAGHAGDRTYLGLNYKLYQRGTNCSGGCTDIPTQTEQTTALDLGVQVRVSKDSSLFVGAALRNAGPRLQVNDAAQADPLPTRLDVGVTWVPRIASLGPDTRLRVGAGIVNAIPLTSPGLRIGADLGWRQKLHLRAGYAYEAPGGSGPSIGLGASTGRLQIDIARLFSDNVANTSQPPTYFSLRYDF